MDNAQAAIATFAAKRAATHADPLVATKVSSTRYGPRA